MQTCLLNIQKTSSQATQNSCRHVPEEKSLYPRTAPILGPIVLCTSTLLLPGGRVEGTAAAAVRQLYGSLEILRAADCRWWSRIQTYGATRCRYAALGRSIGGICMLADCFSQLPARSCNILRQWGWLHCQRWLLRLPQAKCQVNLVEQPVWKRNVL